MLLSVSSSGFWSIQKSQVRAPRPQDSHSACRKKCALPPKDESRTAQVVEHCGQTQRKECSVGRRRWINLPAQLASVARKRALRMCPDGRLPG